MKIQTDFLETFSQKEMSIDKISQAEVQKRFNALNPENVSIGSVRLKSFVQ